MANTLQIKRRTSAPGNQAGAPTSLAVAELAFNEVDNTLYIGRSTAGSTPITVAAIGGSGAFLALSGTQTASGSYTFNTGTVTLDGTVTGTGINTYVLAKRLNEFTAPNASVGFNGQKITNLADPTDPQDAATKAYVDAARSGLDVKASVRAATTANITLSGTQTIDGVALIAGDRVLVKNQSTANQNGIYVVAAGAWARATDADVNAEVTAGLFTFVEEGTANADSGWVLSTLNPITVGTTALTFNKFSGAGQIAGQIEAGAGMTKGGTQGNTLDVGTASSDRIVVNADNIDLATVGVTAGTYSGITVDVYGRVTSATNNVFPGATGAVVRVGANGQLAVSQTISDTNLPAAGTAGTYRSVTTDAYGRVTAGTNPTTFAGYGISDTSANLKAAITDETGSGSLVFATSPTLVTPNIGAATATSISIADLEFANGAATWANVEAISFEERNLLNAAGVSVLNWNSGVTLGNYTTLSPSATAARTVTFPDATGTVALTNNNLSAFAATTSAQLAGVISDETGSGKLAFATSPTFTTSVLTDSTTFGVFDTTATTVNAFGAATTLNLGYDGAASTTTIIAGGATSSGNTKTVHVGSGVLSGSTVSVEIGTGNTNATSQISIGTFRAESFLNVWSAASFQKDVSVAGALTVTGNLTVNGTTTTVNSTVTTIDDPIITLGGDTAPTVDDNKDRGVEFRWHNGTAAKIGFFGFDDSTGKFTFIPDGVNSSETFSGTLGTIDVGAVHINGSAFGVSNLAGLGTNVATFLATPSSANLKSAVTDETGSGALVFATSPTLVTPHIGHATADSITVGENVSAESLTVDTDTTIADGTIRWGNDIVVSIEERILFDVNGAVALSFGDPGVLYFGLTALTTNATTARSVAFPDAAGTVLLDSTICAAVADCTLDGGTF